MEQVPRFCPLPRLRAACKLTKVISRTRSTLLLVAIAAGAALPHAAPAHGQGSTGRVNAKVIEGGRLQAIGDAGIAVGDALVYANGNSSKVEGPLGRGQGTNLVAANSRGQILVAQKFGPLHYFIYDRERKNFTPVSLAAEVTIDGVAQTVQLAYLTGMDDAGRVFGAFAHAQTACAAVGKPTLGTAGDASPPPATPASFDFIGCPGRGAAIRSVNSKGQIAGDFGRQAFLWSNGILTPIAFPGSIETRATAVNDAGVVVGNFIPGYQVSPDGVVATAMKPGMTLRTGFIYDGQNFRYVTLPGIAPAVTLGGINNRGQITGYFDAGEYNFHSFVAEVNSFPIAKMAATLSELTAAAVDRKLATARARAASGGDTDKACRILQGGIGQGPASILRALQALEAAGTLSGGKRVQVIYANPSGILDYNYISLETLRGGVIGQLLNVLMKQLSDAQATTKGMDAVVDAVDALAQEQGLRDLRAAGELAPFGQPVLNSAQNQFTPAARAKFKQTLLSAIVFNLSVHPIEIPPGNMELWHGTSFAPRQVDALTKTVSQIKEELGVPTAAIFLAWNEVRESNIGGPFDPDMEQDRPNIGGLFDWEVVEDLVSLNSNGEQAQAEQVLRVLADAPAPGKCPGLDALKASRTFKEDGLMTHMNGIRPRADLAGAIAHIAGQQWSAIYTRP
jgi:hypothetical protein